MVALTQERGEMRIDGRLDRRDEISSDVERDGL